MLEGMFIAVLVFITLLALQGKWEMDNQPKVDEPKVEEVPLNWALCVAVWTAAQKSAHDALVVWAGSEPVMLGSDRYKEMDATVRAMKGRYMTHIGSTVMIGHDAPEFYLINGKLEAIECETVRPVKKEKAAAKVEKSSEPTLTVEVKQQRKAAARKVAAPAVPARPKNLDDTWEWRWDSSLEDGGGWFKKEARKHA
jgi:hypothetical protein